MCLLIIDTCNLELMGCSGRRFGFRETVLQVEKSNLVIVDIGCLFCESTVRASDESKPRESKSIFSSPGLKLFKLDARSAKSFLISVTRFYESLYTVLSSRKSLFTLIKFTTVGINVASQSEALK